MSFSYPTSLRWHDPDQVVRVYFLSLVTHNRLRDQTPR